MAKRVVVSLVVIAVALLGSSAVFAECSPVPVVSAEAFLASLQAPAPATASDVPILTGLNEPAPIPMSCTSQCMKCGTNKVKLCTTCNGVVTCEACHSGTVCST